MLKVVVWYEEDGEVAREELRYLRPRTYMTGWSFDRMLKYVKEECECSGINLNSVDEITIINEREQWQVNFSKEEK